MLRSTLLALSLLAGPGARAADVPPAMSQYIYADLMTWINAPEVVAAVQAQNAATKMLSKAQIAARDELWRTEASQATGPLVESVLQAPLADFLRSQAARSEGRITHVVVMDSRGLNVAASTVVPDYWQAEEDRFTNTFPRGSGAVFIDKIETDAEAKTYRGQVSFSLTDPATGYVIGVISVGLDANAFQ